MKREREEEECMAEKRQLPRDLTHFVDRPLALLEEAFKALSAEEINSLLPEELKGIPFDELKRMCHSQLCRLPKSSLLRILNVTATSAQETRERMQQVSPKPNDSESEAAGDRAKLEQPESYDNEYRDISIMCTSTQMEILELELRARAIRSLMDVQGQKGLNLSGAKHSDTDE
ncbi:uncharacterized protein LOC135391155 isoform X1 [Ornithodoros turicata]|uniref:uncharacterized protein LOC135391155 isoform X1 n=1 Tax=Ornithodoros turicata TaxID=34597 RepID=UPI003139CD4A